MSGAAPGQSRGQARSWPPLAVVALAAGLAFGSSQTGRALLHHKQGLDLAPQVAATRAALERRDFALYDWPALQTAGRRFGLHGPLGPDDPLIEFAYAPSALFAYLPLAVLPWPVARIAWFIVSVASLLLAVTTWARLVCPPGHSPRHWGLGAAIATLGYFPATYGWMAGQSNDIILLLLVLSFAAWRAGDPMRAGTLAAPAFLWKLFTGAPALFWLARLDRRALLATLIAVAALALISLALVEPGTWGAWLAYVASPAKGATVAMRDHSIAGLASRWFTANTLSAPLVDSLVLARATRWSLTLGTLLLAAVTLRRRWPAIAPATAIQWSSTLVLAVLLVPRAWEHYGALLLPAFIACAAELVRRAPSRARDAAAALLGASFGSWAWLLMDRDDYAAAAGWPLVLGIKLAASLVLQALCAWLVLTSKRERDSDRSGVGTVQA